MQLDIEILRRDTEILRVDIEILRVASLISRAADAAIAAEPVPSDVSTGDELPTAIAIVPTAGRSTELLRKQPVHSLTFARDFGCTVVGDLRSA